MSTLEFTPVARPLPAREMAWPLAASLVGRLPLAALGLVLLLHTRALGGSYPLAGAVAAALGLGLAAGAPLLGRLADRRGGAPVLVACTAASAVTLCGLAALPRGAAPGLLLALAGLAGLVHPPVGGIVRSAWPRLLSTDTVERVYAVESTALELTYIAGPALLGGLLAARSSRLALVTAAMLLVLGSGALVGHGRLRRATGAHPEDYHRTPWGALASPGVLLLTLAFTALGVALGGTEVAVAAACAKAGHQPVAGLLLGLWGLGSMVGGGIMAKRPPRGDPARRLVALTAAMALLHAGLALAIGAGLPALGLALFLAGAVVAPGFATGYGLTSRIAPPGTVTEAFSWLSTGIAAGVAAGSALAGSLVDGPGVPVAFAAAALAPLVAAALLRLRRRALAPAPAPA